MSRPVDPASLVPEAFLHPQTGFRGWRLRLQTGRGIPTPALHDGRVLVGGGFGSHDFYALDRDRGTLGWHLHTKDDGPTAASVDRGYCAFNTESCTLVVTDVHSGRILWERWLGDPLLAQPAIAGDAVYMAWPERGTHWLGAFALADGTPRWRTELSHDVITAPVCAGALLYLSTLDGRVWCLDPASGHVRWCRDERATSAPWVYGGEIYVARRESGESPEAEPRERVRRTAARGRSHDFAAKGAAYLNESWGDEAKRRYYDQDADVGFGHAPQAAKLHVSGETVGERLVSRVWRFQGSRPVVVDGILFDTTGDRLEARELASGELIWSWQDAIATPGERRLTPPAAANGRVWAGTWDGRILSWDATTGRVRWSVPAGSPCHWQPAIADGWVCAGLEDGSVLAFHTGDDGDDGWRCWGGGPGHNGDADASAAVGMAA